MSDALSSYNILYIMQLFWHRLCLICDFQGTVFLLLVSVNLSHDLYIKYITHKYIIHVYTL